MLVDVAVLVAVCVEDDVDVCVTVYVAVEVLVEDGQIPQSAGHDPHVSAPLHVLSPQYGTTSHVHSVQYKGKYRVGGVAKSCSAQQQCAFCDGNHC